MSDAAAREILNIRFELARRYMARCPARVWVVEAELAAASRA